MRRLHDSVLGLMMSMVGVALGLAALRFSTPIVAGVVLLLCILLFGLAILTATHRRGASRAFWSGFALMGCAYLGLSSGSWTLAEAEAEAGGTVVTLAGAFTGPGRPPPLGHWLVTTPLLDALRPRLQADGGKGGSVERVAGLLWFHPKRQAIYEALDRPLAMPFARETPLEDVLDYVRSSTRGPHLPEGIPIYIDPEGLMEAVQTTSSPVSLHGTGLPLRRSLVLLLQQLDLAYTVDDDLLTITSTSRISPSDRVESFRRVGHGLLSLAFALVGGLAARVLWATGPCRNGVSGGLR